MKMDIYKPLVVPTNHDTITTTVTATVVNDTTLHQQRRQKKIIVILGPTGSGKSKLSIDLASHYVKPSEIINSDKIQIYKGLDITTNKIPRPDRKGVPHHLIGEFESTQSTPEFTQSKFRSRAAQIISQIISRRKMPFLVGGSNSFIYSLLAKQFDPELDVFEESNSVDSVCKQLRYDCCFLWVDVNLPVLRDYLDIRLDEMLESGMFEELEEFFNSESSNSVSHQLGIKKAIGVPEFEKYFNNNQKGGADDVAEYERAVRLMKENTWQLAKRQIEKIQRLRDAGWDLHKIDATEAFQAVIDEKRRVVKKNRGGRMTSSEGKVMSAKQEARVIWEKQVVEPSVKIIKKFLMG